MINASYYVNTNRLVCDIKHKRDSVINNVTVVMVQAFSNVRHTILILSLFLVKLTSSQLKIISIFESTNLIISLRLERKNDASFCENLFFFVELMIPSNLEDCCGSFVSVIRNHLADEESAISQRVAIDQSTLSRSHDRDIG